MSSFCFLEQSLKRLMNSRASFFNELKHLCKLDHQSLYMLCSIYKKMFQGC